ncbi:MAG: hypothetical protein R3D85_11865 [Paracoccaceae bacterium]
MSDEMQYNRDESKRAFQQGMLMAVGIAFAPLALVSAGLLLSGHSPNDLGSGLRYGLVVLWLIYLFTADRIAGLRLWLRIPLLREADKGEVITILAFSALLATMRLDPSMARAEMLPEWAKGFGLILAGFGGLYVAYKVTNRSRRIARARGAVRQPFSARLMEGLRGLFQGLTARFR